MDSPRTTRSGSRTRRKIFSCPICDEVFVDEESLERHKLTHEEGGDAPAPEPEPEAAPPAAEAAPPEAEFAPEPEPRAGRRSLSSVRRQRQQAQDDEPAPSVEAPSQYLPPQSVAPAIPVDDDATEVVHHAELGPMGWEQKARSGGGLGFKRLWRFIEDFSEWLVRGGQETLGTVGGGVAQGVGIAIRGLLVLGVAALCLYAGTWFGRTYGQRFFKRGQEGPVVPPTRTIHTTPEASKRMVQNLVLGFYSSLNKRDYQAAYDALSSDWQKDLAFDDFRNGYSSTKNARCQVKGIQSLKDGRYRLEFALEVTEDGKKKRYRGNYIAVHSSDGWRLDEGDIR